MEETPHFSERLRRRAAVIAQALGALLPTPEQGGRLAAAMRYAALGGGKRLRGFLTLECAALPARAGASEAGALRAAAALECLHAYSLVHDDLPAMDDDDLRRGRPTVHVEFDEATAILVGDALQSLAFEILAAPETHPDGAVRAALCGTLAAAAGGLGMALGQMMDIEAEREAESRAKSRAENPAGPGGPGLGDLDAITRLQSLKTGRLIRAAAAIGARIGGASESELAAVGRYADALGLAFQIKDDLLDVEGDEAAAGKRLGKDAAAGKATFVGLLGVDGARRMAEERVAAAHAALSSFGEKAAPLRQAADFVLSRDR